MEEQAFVKLAFERYKEEDYEAALHILISMGDWTKDCFGNGEYLMYLLLSKEKGKTEEAFNYLERSQMKNNPDALNTITSAYHTNNEYFLFTYYIQAAEQKDILTYEADSYLYDDVNNWSTLYKKPLIPSYFCGAAHACWNLNNRYKSNVHRQLYFLGKSIKLYNDAKNETENLDAWSEFISLLRSINVEKINQYLDIFWNLLSQDTLLSVDYGSRLFISFVKDRIKNSLLPHQ